MSRRNIDIANEEKVWGEIFSKEISKAMPEKFSSFWWFDYYTTMVQTFKGLLKHSVNPKILEPGCGSGKASILLSQPDCEITLLDISENALKFAKHTANIWHRKNVSFIQGDIFKMDLPDQHYDLVWNLGVIEHYQDCDIKIMVGEMIRKAKNGGIVAIGYPNIFSGPIIKAWILKYIPKSWTDAYRLDTERFFSRPKITKIIEDALSEQGVKKNIQYYTVGNPLPMETPKLLILTLGRIINYLFPRNRFLTFIVCKIERDTHAQ